MLIREPVEGFKLRTPKAKGIFLLAALVVLVWFPKQSHGSSSFHLEKDAQHQGLVSPFKAVSVPLSDFLNEYGRITSTQFIVGGNWVQQLKGPVTLFLRKPLKTEVLTELFYRVRADNGYAAVDGSSGTGIIIERTRDTRDEALPVDSYTEEPDSSRLVTVYRNLKYANGEHVARMMRSFMPALGPPARIIPTSRSQVL